MHRFLGAKVEMLERLASELDITDQMAALIQMLSDLGEVERDATAKFETANAARSAMDPEELTAYLRHPRLLRHVWDLIVSSQQSRAATALFHLMFHSIDTLAFGRDLLQYAIERDLRQGVAAGNCLSLRLFGQLVDVLPPTFMQSSIAPITEEIVSKGVIMDVRHVTSLARAVACLS